MEDIIDENIEKLEIELNNTNIAIKNVQDTIKTYQAKANELTLHVNYTKGALDILITVKKEGETEDV